jgi:hypothetical protein
MIARAVDRLVAALTPLGLPVRLPLAASQLVGPCYVVQPPAIDVVVTAGRCHAGQASVDVLVVARNTEDFAGLVLDTEAAVAALAAAGIGIGTVEPASLDTPDLANPLPAYTIPTTL